MNSVLNSYRRKRQKVNSKTSGMGANEVYTSTWFAYNALQFLHTKYLPRPTKNTIEVSYYVPYYTATSTHLLIYMLFNGPYGR